MVISCSSFQVAETSLKAGPGRSFHFYPHLPGTDLVQSLNLGPIWQAPFLLGRPSPRADLFSNLHQNLLGDSPTTGIS
jgi:hypothetical protein